MIEFKLEELGNNPAHQLRIFDGEKEIGFFLIVTQALDIYEVHTHFIKEAFGSATIIGKEAILEGFRLIPSMNILVTKVPKNNPLAKRLTLSVGMKPYGLLPNSFSTDSGFIDQELFYISRGDLKCQQH